MNYNQEVIDPGDRASRLAKEICSQSYKNCPAVTVVPHQPSNFRGPVGYLWKRHILEQMLEGSDDPETSWSLIEGVENDGAGGKPQFFTLVGDPDVFRNLGWEIITMTTDDFSRSGRFPAIMVNELNAKRITEANFPLFQATIEGYGKALEEAQLVNITGEIAIMKHSVTAFCDDPTDKEQFILTWGGTCIGLSRKDLLIDGSNIKPGMLIIGLWDPGYRCNGGTFFTNIILEKWGWPLNRCDEMSSFVKGLTIPSQSYAKTINRLVGWNPDGSVGKQLVSIAGIAHITGGGVWGKFGEILPEGVGAYLASMPRPAEILLKGQELSWETNKYYLSDWEAYRTFHGGCGMLIVLSNESSAETVIREAKKDGICAVTVGETTRSKDNEIIIFSRFKEGKKLSSKYPE
jgi:phosphoribosylformylglycinamidine cyclo-ligase